MVECTMINEILIWIMQVMNLQAELTYVQARLATMQRMPMAVAPLPPPQSSSPQTLPSSDHLASNADMQSVPIMHYDPLQPHSASFELSSILFNQSDQQMEDRELQALAREFVTKYLPGVRFQQSNSP